VGQSAQQLAEYVLAQHEAATVVQILNRARVRPAPLKGVLLQRLVYEPGMRKLSDLDFLIASADRARACAALRAHNYELVHEDVNARSYVHPDRAIHIDLHWALFPHGLFRLSTEEVLGRATLDDTLFEGEVYRLEALDVLAHLVGNFAKGLESAAYATHVADFAVLVGRGLVPARDAAHHLCRCGMRRAGAYVLTALGSSLDVQWSAAMWDHLGVTRHDTRVAHGLVRLARRLPDSSRWRIPLRYMLQDTWWQTATTVGHHVRWSLTKRRRPFIRSR
jgi:hypothetical protein